MESNNKQSKYFIKHSIFFVALISLAVEICRAIIRNSKFILDLNPLLNLLLNLNVVIMVICYIYLWKKFKNRIAIEDHKEVFWKIMNISFVYQLVDCFYQIIYLKLMNSNIDFFDLFSDSMNANVFFLVPISILGLLISWHKLRVKTCNLEAIMLSAGSIIVWEIMGVLLFFVRGLANKYDLLTIGSTGLLVVLMMLTLLAYKKIKNLGLADLKEVTKTFMPTWFLLGSIYSLLKVVDLIVENSREDGIPYFYVLYGFYNQRFWILELLIKGGVLLGIWIAIARKQGKFTYIHTEDL